MWKAFWISLQGYFLRLRVDGLRRHAEVSELIGIYMLINLVDKFNKSMFGLYRDDGLMVI